MNRSFRRILVALDASEHSQAALQEAAALAERMQAELAGIFVLDAELLRMSELPAVHETGLTSASRRSVDPEGMERALKLQASRARVALDAAARKHRLRSSFRLSRGNVVAELVRAATQADLVAMGLLGHRSMTGRRLGSTARGVTAQVACSVLLLMPGSRTGRSVVVAYDNSPGSARALERGSELARRREAELVVVLCGAAEDLVDLRARADKALNEDGLSAQFDDLRQDRTGLLSALLRRHDCGLLVIAHDNALIEARDELLGELGLPVLLTK